MQLTKTPDLGNPTLHFIDADFDPSRVPDLAARAKSLLDREIDSKEALETWLYDVSELSSAVGAGLARRYIAMTCDTSDDKIKESYLAYEKDVIPAWSVHENDLNKKFLACSQIDELGPGYEVLVRNKKRAAEIFREENTKLRAKEAELDARYNEIQGSITVELDGETLTAQQCGAKLEEQDRDLRERAWRALSERRLQDRDAIEDVFDELRKLRKNIAKNAGFENFRDYAFAEFCRFDYGPKDCHAYHDAVEKVVVPAMETLCQERREVLGVDKLRPWDMRVGLTGRPPVQPFTDASGYEKVTRKIFEEVDPVFAKDFDILTRNGLLDLMSRKGKAPGGYMYPVEDIRLPFIFINAVGLHNDVQTLLHEGGHAFHTLAVRDQRLSDYRNPPMEFAEVASMSMELLGLERLDRVYEEQDARDAYAGHLAEIPLTFTWVATIDAFQDWMYTNEDHTREERKAKWIELRQRFAPYLDWSEIEAARDYEWHRQGHIFGVPFYYIEYAIAQIGALQVWRNERANHSQAIEQYRAALSLGGSRPLPQLFETAGTKFQMDASMLSTLMDELLEAHARASA